MIKTRRKHLIGDLLLQIQPHQINRRSKIDEVEETVIVVLHEETTKEKDEEKKERSIEPKARIGLFGTYGKFPPDQCDGEKSGDRQLQKNDDAEAEFDPTGNPSDKTIGEFISEPIGRKGSQKFMHPCSEP